MAFVRSVARQMGHGLERTDVNLSLRKWWKLGYTRQNGLVSGGMGWERGGRCRRIACQSVRWCVDGCAVGHR